MYFQLAAASHAITVLFLCDKWWRTVCDWPPVQHSLFAACVLPTEIPNAHPGGISQPEDFNYKRVWRLTIPVATILKKTIRYDASWCLPEETKKLYLMELIGFILFCNCFEVGAALPAWLVFNYSGLTWWVGSSVSSPFFLIRTICVETYRVIGFRISIYFILVLTRYC